MTNKKNSASKLTFGYKLVDIRKTGYFENDIETYKFKDEVKKGKVPFRLTVNIAINSEAGIIDIILKVKFYYKEQKKEFDLFGINTSHKFKIKDFSNIFPQNKKNEFFIPDEVIASFLGIAISGTRGMLKMVNTNKLYDNVILPLLHPTEVLSQSKAIPKTSKK